MPNSTRVVGRGVSLNALVPFDLESFKKVVFEKIGREPDDDDGNLVIVLNEDPSLQTFQLLYTARDQVERGRFFDLEPQIWKLLEEKEVDEDRSYCVVWDQGNKTLLIVSVMWKPVTKQ